MAFRPDGLVLATGGADGAVNLWDVTTGKPSGMPLLHDGPVEQVSFAPDGQTILTAGQDRNARLWQLPPPAAGTVDQIVLSTQVLTGMELDNDGVAHVLDATTWQQRRQQFEDLGRVPRP